MPSFFSPFDPRVAAAKNPNTSLPVRQRIFPVREQPTTVCLDQQAFNGIGGLCVTLTGWFLFMKTLLIKRMKLLY